MKKLNLSLIGKEQLTKQQMKSINGGSSCEAYCGAKVTLYIKPGECQGTCTGVDYDRVECNTPYHLDLCSNYVQY